MCVNFSSCRNILCFSCLQELSWALVLQHQGSCLLLQGAGSAQQLVTREGVKPPTGAELLAAGISPRGSNLHGLGVLSAVHAFHREGGEEKNSIWLCWFSGVKRWNSSIQENIVYGTALARESSILMSCLFMIDCVKDKASTRGCLVFLFLCFH